MSVLSINNYISIVFGDLSFSHRPSNSDDFCKTYLENSRRIVVYSPEKKQLNREVIALFVGDEYYIVKEVNIDLTTSTTILLILRLCIVVSVYLSCNSTIT